MIEVMEVTVSKLERTTTAKGNITYGANAFAVGACNEYQMLSKNSTVKQQKVLWGSSSGSVSSQGTMTTSQLTSTISSTPTRMTTTTITPGTIIPGNPYV
jgi:hypothetical protein